MICAIINFAAEIYCCHINEIRLSHYPCIQNWCANTPTWSWINSKCNTSMFGCKLALILLGLSMETKLGVQTKQLPTAVNVIAGDILHLTKENSNYDYKNLIKCHPSLTSCRQFKPSNTLLGMFWGILLHNNSPGPLTIKISYRLHSAQSLLWFLERIQLTWQIFNEQHVCYYQIICWSHYIFIKWLHSSVYQNSCQHDQRLP